MLHKNPNMTYTAFWCAGYYDNAILPLYAAPDTAPINTDQTTIPTTSSYSPTAFTSTGVTQSSQPAAAAGTLTMAPTSLNHAGMHPSPRIMLVLIPLLLMLNM